MIRINQCQYLSSACPTPNDARTAWERYWIFQLMPWHIKVVGASQVHFTLCKHMIMPAVYQCFYINDVRNKSDLNASRGQSSMSNALLMLCCSVINSPSSTRNCLATSSFGATSCNTKVILILTKFGILISTWFQIVPFGLRFSKQFLFLMYDPSFCCP